MLRHVVGNARPGQGGRAGGGYALRIRRTHHHRFRRSGIPDWKDLLRKFEERLALRKVMIDKYLDGKLQTLDQVALEKKSPTVWEKVRGQFQSSDDTKKTTEMTYDKAPELLDTLWGYYFATGSHGRVT